MEEKSLSEVKPCGGKAPRWQIEGSGEHRDIPDKKFRELKEVYT